MNTSKEHPRQGFATPGELAACPNLVELFLGRARAQPERPFLWSRRDGVWRSLTWEEVLFRIRAAARGLKEIGIRPGDRVGLVSENRPEWLIADLAILAAGGVTVPAYVTNTVADHRHVLGNSGARAVIVSTPSLFRAVAQAAAGTEVECLISIEPTGREHTSLRVLSWASWMEAAGPEEEDPLLYAASSLGRKDLACILHTSGTAGMPKGVTLSHGAVLSNLEGAWLHLEELGLKDEVFLSFLPLSHAYEHTAGQFLPLALGAQIYYAESAAAVPAILPEVRPTILIAVPRLWETLHRRILAEARRSGFGRHRLLSAALRLGRLRYERGGIPWFWRLPDTFLERLVRSRVRDRFGGRLKAVVSGGAPLQYEIGLFFTALGFRLLQGYGLTEAAPVVSCNPASAVRLHTVGPPLPGVEISLAEDGEILISGELLTNGYWNDPEATAQLLAGGQLHTGDIGRIDPDGYITITDRKKDIIKNSGGDMISPLRVEGLLTLEPEIMQAMVFGDRRPHLVAILVPDRDHAQQWAAERGRTWDARACVADPDFHRWLALAVERVNGRLSSVERVRRFCIAPEPFTVENALLTPSLKVRRHRILEVYLRELEALYEQRSGP